MTLAEITRHRAGPELDRLVHERVMGYTPRREGGWWTQDGEPCPACWDYSTSSTWSMIVAETLVSSYHPKRWAHFALSTVRTDSGRAWHAMFRRGDETAWAEGETPEEAICLASVIAVTALERETRAPAPAPDPVEQLKRSLWSPPSEPAWRSAEAEDSREPVGAVS